ncbi:MAG: SHIRT domain-containing protein [Eubacteriales bacterium]|nr:SHIRT domain-containing protein [Eubacteriales bacterium]
MKRKKPTLMIIALLAILLVCFILPSFALAATTKPNDNHTDTADYCLRAHDVSIGLSEFSGKTRAELESDIISASAFAFLIRDTVSGSGSFEPITSGYSVDFSSLTEAASSSGYVISVSLPAISLSVPSVITFRVFVVDDLPHPRAVSYEFISGTAEHALPDGVTAQLPADESILSGETVTPASSFTSVRDGAGMWTFSGWSPDQVTLSDSDVTFTGTWVWTPLPVYTVTFTFVSGTNGHSLPNGVLSKQPMSTTGVDGDVFTPSDSFHAYHMVEGAWRFHGWNVSSQTVAGGNLTFVGEWRWHKNKIVITPTPVATATSTPIPTPTIVATPAPTLPTSSPEQPSIQVLEQTPNEPPTPTTSGAAGGAAKMIIATALAALVASQAFAVASDLKVLNWYQAKKAAARRS